MSIETLKQRLNSISDKKVITKISDTEEEVCDIQTGECHVIKSKDGLIERLDKKYITEDGRQLLSD
jgi:hypothetical protein